ncbi:PEP-CTERM sorting domain-containing protein [Thauera sp.]|uniref:PEP-CTERM sorting domain-containing protein n=1 Tax=Thauera sp. TaxID=1905334 RepID=UPI0039E41913
MKKTAFIAATAALATFSTGASAAYVSQVNSLTGNFGITGFNTNPNEYRISFTGLRGGGVVNTGPSGNYEVSVGPGSLGSGATVTTSVNGRDESRTTNNVISLFTGSANLNGLPVGERPLVFGSGAISSPITVDFSGNYDGAATKGILGFLSLLLGVSFGDQYGDGDVSITGRITDTSVELAITEDAGGWRGAGQLLKDLFGTLPNGAPNDAIGGTFTIDNLAITATQVPEPASLALLGLGMAGLAAVRRRKKAA